MKKILTALVITLATSALANDPAPAKTKSVTQKTKNTAEATTDEQTGAPPVAKKEMGATKGIEQGSTEPQSARNQQVLRDSHHTSEATKDEKTSPPPVAKKEAMGGSGTATAPAPTEKGKKVAKKTKQTSDQTTDEQTGAPPVANKENVGSTNDQTNNVKNKGETPPTK